jgi:acyl transferase domain-containing protein
MKVSRIVVPAAGTSSFGMSGVNAHMLFGAVSADAAPAAASPRLLWQRQRFWPGPMLHHLAHPNVITAAVPEGSIV